MAYDTKWSVYDPWRSVVEANTKVLGSLPKHFHWTGEFAYRFVDARYAAADPWGDGDDYHVYTQVELQSFAINRVTPQGIRIFVRNYGLGGDKAWSTRFVNLGANKRFALPTIPEAIESYIARKKRQIRIYSGKIQIAEECIFQVRDPWAPVDKNVPRTYQKSPS